MTLSGARVAVTKQLSVEPSVTVNRGVLPAGTFTTSLLRARVDFAFTPLRFLSALLQYSSNDQSLSQQHPLPVGVPAGQRAVRRLHRRPRHRGARLPQPAQSRRGGEDHPAASASRAIGERLTLDRLVRTPADRRYVPVQCFAASLPMLVIDRIVVGPPRARSIWPGVSLVSLCLTLHSQ